MLLLIPTKVLSNLQNVSPLRLYQISSMHVWPQHCVAQRRQLGLLSYVHVSASWAPPPSSAQLLLSIPYQDFLSRSIHLSSFPGPRAGEEAVHVLDMGSGTFVLEAQVSQEPNMLSRQSRLDLTESPRAVIFNSWARAWNEVTEACYLMHRPVKESWTKSAGARA